MKIPKLVWATLPNTKQSANTAKVYDRQQKGGEKRKRKMFQNLYVQKMRNCQIDVKTTFILDTLRASEYENKPHSEWLHTKGGKKKKTWIPNRKKTLKTQNQHFKFSPFNSSERRGKMEEEKKRERVIEKTKKEREKKTLTKKKGGHWK